MTRDFKSTNWDETTARLFIVVRGRSNIQYAAHALLALMKSRHETRAANSSASNRYEVLVAVIFSLWRAVFLADGASGWDAVLADAQTFLEKVIRDNSIGYLDDWNNRAWSFIYYLNNARFRLKELVDTWPEFKDRLGTTSDWLEKPIVGSSSLTMWEQHCTAVQAAVEALTDEKKES